MVPDSTFWQKYFEEFFEKEMLKGQIDMNIVFTFF